MVRELTGFIGYKQQLRSHRPPKKKCTFSEWWRRYSQDLGLWMVEWMVPSPATLAEIATVAGYDHV